MWQALETKARFIAQVMTGDNARPPGRGHRRPGTLVRRGEGDRVGQPGGADARRGRRRAAAARRPAEEPRRRAVPRPPEPPRVAGDHRQRSRSGSPSLEADLGPWPVTTECDFRIGERPCRRDEAQALLASGSSPSRRQPSRSGRCRSGCYRGLSFGLVLHPHRGPDVYLEGAASRQSCSPASTRGPRAVLNAVERIAAGYESRIADDRDDLGLARGQLRDYEARVGRPFPHDAYIDRLSELRRPAQPRRPLGEGAGRGGGRPAHRTELADRIRASGRRTPSRPRHRSPARRHGPPRRNGPSRPGSASVRRRLPGTRLRRRTMAIRVARGVGGLRARDRPGTCLTPKP